MRNFRKYISDYTNFDFVLDIRRCDGANFIIETILDIEILDERDTVSDLQHLAKTFNKVELTQEEK